jgi:hypothetical protein
MLQSNERSMNSFTAANQSELPLFFSPRQVNLKIGQIPEDDLPKLAYDKPELTRHRSNWCHRQLSIC